MNKEFSGTNPAQVEVVSAAATAASIAAQASEIRKAASPEALLFSYVYNHGPLKGRNLQSLLKLLTTAVELGHVDWPLSLRHLFYQKDVLHFGCGATLYGPVFRALGAKTYTGIDRTLDPTRKKFRSRLEKKTISTDFALVDVVRLIPGISYLQADELSSRQAFDVVVMQAVTHTIPRVDLLFSQIHQALRPNGEIWFSHENFFGWGGHQTAPRNPAQYDSGDPAHQAIVDWGHLLFEAREGDRLRAFNRMTPAELRALTNSWFEVSQWLTIPERSSVSERLTPVLRERLSAWSDSDLLTRQIVVRASKRDLD